MNQLLTALPTAAASVFAAGSDDLLRQLDASSRLIPWEADAEEGVFTHVGEQAIEMLGYPLESWYAKSFWPDIIHPDDREATIAACDRAKHVHDHYVLEYRMLAADGRIVWIQDIISVERCDGQPVMLRGYLIDITTRKFAEEALEQVRRREAELARAERLSTMAQMAAELAHELNQPLYAIANFSETCLAYLAQNKANTEHPDLQRWTEIISQQARRAGDILRRIHGRARQGELDLSDVQLNDCVRETLALVDFSIQTRRVTVECVLAPDLPTLNADRLLIEQVLVNLVRNSLEAMDEVATNERRLVVRTFAVGTDGVGLEVTDSGCGLVNCDRDRLFEPLFTTKPEGTGLGLSFCRSTIEAHRGRIWATDAVPRGAAFQFHLPACASYSVRPHQSAL